MSVWSRLNVRRSRAPLAAAFGAVVLLATGVETGARNEDLYRQQRIREVEADAGFLAKSVAGALAFDDNRAAQDYVDALKVNPEIGAAGIYDERGVLVAGFSREGAAPPRSASEAYPAVFRDWRVEATVRVEQGSTRLGAVYLRTTTEPLGRIVARHAGLALLAVMASLLTAVMGAAQAAVRRANAELEARARELGEANRELNVQMEERERAEEALRQSQKMEAVGQLTGGVAHDFNNILMVVSSGLEMLDRTNDPDRQQMLKDSLRQAVDRGASLTRQLLTISRRTALQPRVIDLKPQIESVRVLLDRSLREDIAVELVLDPALWSVEADPSELEVALLNLALNARDAMPDGGAITFRAENQPAMTDGELRGDFVRISVSDEGVGMTRETLRRIFEPFFTTKGVGKGTGLGLAQVYGFARASGGDVRVQSQPGEGSTVSLFLPRSTKAAAAPAPADAAAAQPTSASAQGRVLLVEDEDTVASLVTEMLKELGYEVTRAPSAAVALSRLTEPDVDLVFSDMVMPGRMNGMELAREIARRRPNLPVVLTTGYSEAATAARREGLRLLVKPYRIDDLASALEAARRERGQALQAIGA